MAGRKRAAEAEAGPSAPRRGAMSAQGAAAAAAGPSRVVQFALDSDSDDDMLFVPVGASKEQEERLLRGRNKAMEKVRAVKRNRALFDEREMNTLRAVLPDIEPDFAKQELDKMYATLPSQDREKDGEAAARLIEALLERDYPKLAPGAGRARPRRDESDEEAEDEQPAGKGKGKGKAKASEGRRKNKRPSGGSASQPVEVEDSAGIECPICCDDDFPPSEVIRCPDGHPFCSTCCRRQAEEQIGMRKSKLQCMDMDGCEREFTRTEVRRFLPRKSFNLWEKIVAEQDVAQAGLEGLESCPYCPWACVVEASFEDAKIFECQNEECMRHSCRGCREAPHLPKTCEEAKEEAKQNRLHTGAEALAEVLMRRCPKPGCSRPIVKEEQSCNKVRCTCGTLMCYVCRVDITALGYAHFDQDPANYAIPKIAGKCPLWDDTAARHAREIAAKRAELGEAAPPDVGPPEPVRQVPVSPLERVQRAIAAFGYGHIPHEDQQIIFLNGMDDNVLAARARDLVRRPDPVMAEHLGVLREGIRRARIHVANQNMVIERNRQRQILVAEAAGHVAYWSRLMQQPENSITAKMAVQNFGRHMREEIALLHQKPFYALTALQVVIGQAQAALQNAAEGMSNAVFKTKAMLLREHVVAARALVEARVQFMAQPRGMGDPAVLPNIGHAQYAQALQQDQHSAALVRQADERIQRQEKQARKSARRAARAAVAAPGPSSLGDGGPIAMPGVRFAPHVEEVPQPGARRRGAVAAGKRPARPIVLPDADDDDDEPIMAAPLPPRLQRPRARQAPVDIEEIDDDDDEPPAPPPRQRQRRQAPAAPVEIEEEDDDEILVYMDGVYVPANAAAVEPRAARAAKRGRRDAPSPRHQRVIRGDAAIRPPRAA